MFQQQYSSPPLVLNQPNQNQQLQLQNQQHYHYQQQQQPMQMQTPMQIQHQHQHQQQQQQVPTLVPYTFTTGELDSLRSKLQKAEQQMTSSSSSSSSSSNSKTVQSIVPLSLNEIRTLQKMVDMTYLQGLSGSGLSPSIQYNNNNNSNSNNNKNSSSMNKSSNTPPSNYICHKCNIPGHYVHNCPNVGGKGSPPSNYLCYKCNVSGHWIQECPLGNQPDYSKPPPSGYCCHRCGIPGHWIKKCPNNNLLENSNGDNNNNNENNYNSYQTDRDTLNYGSRDKKKSHNINTESFDQDGWVFGQQ